MIEELDRIDKKLLLFFNSFHNSFFDDLMFYISKTEFWIPLFLFLVLYTIKEFRKRSILIFITVALVVTASDQLASSVMKPFFKRYRPCHEDSIEEQVHIVKGCGGKYGFVSSHAANTFGAAMFFVFLFRRKNKWFIFLFLWALIVSYSRIYLGKHYPGDILAGGILGILIAILLYKLYQYFDKKIIYRSLSPEN